MVFGGICPRVGAEWYGEVGSGVVGYVLGWVFLTGMVWVLSDPVVCSFSNVCVSHLGR